MGITNEDQYLYYLVILQGLFHCQFCKYDADTW